MRWPGTYACMRPRAQRAMLPSGDRRRARRCRCGEMRHPALPPASSQARGETRLTHRIHLAWRRRAQGHGLLRSSDLSWAATRAAPLASGQVQSARWYERAITVPKHTRPRHVHLVRPSGIQRHNTRQHGGAQRFPAKQFTTQRLTSTRDSSHGDGELRGMSGPEAQTCCGAAVLRLDGQHTGR
jgi:hypothetical protein